jgi:polyisoprenoid-binding protein YceI
MKKLSLILFSFMTVLFLASCGNKPDEEKNAEVGEAGEIDENAGANATTYIIDTEASNVRWEGFKSVGYSHWGPVDISEGTIGVEGDKIVSGSFTIDMTSIQSEDLAEDQEKHDKLIGHLGSDDFFSVSSHPTSTFQIQSVEMGSPATVTGNLTIKGITKSITFPAEITMDGNSLHATADFNIDRTNWDIVYSSASVFDDLGDDFIKDEMNIQLDIHANAADATASAE